MKIKFNEKEMELHYSYEVSMLYEEMMQKSIDYMKLTSKDYEILFYAVFLTTLRYNKYGKLVSFIDFKNWIDDNGGTKLFVDFIKWYVDQVKAEFELIKNDLENEEQPTDEVPLKNV